MPATLPVTGRYKGSDDWLTREFQEAERYYEALPENARPVVVPPAEAEEWSARAERLLEQALREVQDRDDAIPTVLAALAALRAGAGELPEAEAAELAADLYDLDREPECICPPDLVARGGFRGGCPVHSYTRASRGDLG